jgi:hypothetical protein
MAESSCDRAARHFQSYPFGFVRCRFTNAGSDARNLERVGQSRGVAGLRSTRRDERKAAIGRLGVFRPMVVF